MKIALSNWGLPYYLISILVLVIKYLDKRQPRIDGVSFSLQFQVTVHYSRWVKKIRKWSSSSHHSREKRERNAGIFSSRFLYSHDVRGPELPNRGVQVETGSSHICWDTLDNFPQLCSEDRLIFPNSHWDCMKTGSRWQLKPAVTEIF